MNQRPYIEAKGDLPDITPPTDLKPKAKYFEEVGDNCINVDGAIKLMQQIDTPQARTMYRAFRKRFAELRLSMVGVAPEKVREEALFKAFADLGIRTTLTPVKGTME